MLKYASQSNEEIIWGVNYNGVVDKFKTWSLQTTRWHNWHISDILDTLPCEKKGFARKKQIIMILKVTKQIITRLPIIVP